MLSDKCTWRHWLLFNLGEVPTPRLAVIMVKRESAPIDNRRSLYKKHTVALADVKRMALRNKGVIDKCVQMLDKNMAPLVSRRPGSVFVCYARIGLGRPRADFCDLPMRRDEGRVVDQPLVFKRDF
ncbi:hypothetical protein TNCV_4429311 [Trichonephila clavipes]|nr:hypothetical protein TNCV_4429311 [Trichonephila clavipes]